MVSQIPFCTHLCSHEWNIKPETMDMKNNMRHPLRGVCVCVCWVCLSFALIVQTVHFSFLQENENRPQQGFCPSLPLSSLQTVGSLLLHKQLGLMSSNLALMTDSASVPAGSKKPMRTLWKFTPTHISNNRYGICYGIFVIKLFFLLTFPLIKMPPIREDGAMERIAEKKKENLTRTLEFCKSRLSGSLIHFSV